MAQAQGYDQGDFLAVDDLTVVPGQEVTISGCCFAGGVVIDIQSTPRRLGTATADPTGVFTATVTIPTDIAPGQHTITVTGKDIDGPGTLVLRLPITVLAPEAGETRCRQGSRCRPQLRQRKHGPRRPRRRRRHGRRRQGGRRTGPHRIRLPAPPPGRLGSAAGRRRHGIQRAHPPEQKALQGRAGRLLLTSTAPPPVEAAPSISHDSGAGPPESSASLPSAGVSLPAAASEPRRPVPPCVSGP